MKYIKIYVAVTLFVDEQGKAFPLSVMYEGKEYAVDKITDVRQTSPYHVGGLITKRYDCVILGKIRSIYLETTGRWFVEARRL